MRCYRTKPRSDWWPSDESPIKELTVYERDGWCKTGLYDAHGEELLACEERGVLGFIHLKES